ncbi:hypothetical protein Tco_0504815 [Tanacetum coccineum]
MIQYIALKQGGVPIARATADSIRIQASENFDLPNCCGLTKEHQHLQGLHDILYDSSYLTSAKMRLNITPANGTTHPFVLTMSDTVLRKTADLKTKDSSTSDTLGIIHHSNIEYAERIWEEFIQSIQTFLTGRKNIATAARGKKKTAHMLIPSVRSKAGLVRKRRKPKSPLKLVDEPSDEGVSGPARPVVIRELESGRIKPLLEVQGKGKEKVVEEQAAHDLLTLQTLQKKSLADQFIFQKRPPMPTESSAHAESPSMDTELNLTDSETESDEEASKINAGNQEGQAGLNPESQLQTSHVVQARPNLERMDLGTSDASTQQKPEQMDEEFTTTAYPNVQENLKLPTEDQVLLKEPASSMGTLSSLQNFEKDLSFTDQFFLKKHEEEELGKTNAEAEVQSMVSVPIHQDTSSVPPMTTPVIDLTTMQSDSPLPTSTATTSIITTTSLPPPP